MMLIASATVLLGCLFALPVGGEKAKNPTVWADVPDACIVRVGKTYYMSSTTMHMSPGLPIMKSNDLVHWKIASYAYKTLGHNDALDLQNGKNAYGKGSWASSIRYHEGTYYVSTFSSTTGKTYIYTSKNPNRDEWKERSFSPSLHDHSLFFDDDGRIYMVYGAGDIRLVELQPDLTGIVPGSERIIIRNASKAAGEAVGLPAEGSQLFKINDRYYVCNITWPRGGMRTEVVHRADRIDGPYEGRLMFHDQGVAQGGMVDTPDGKWYAYLFQDHGAVGRTPYLVPMEWKDGWPVVGVDGKTPMTLDIPAKGTGVEGIVASDDFRGRSLGLAWQWNHNPDDSLWSLSERKGYLRLRTGRIDSKVTQARNTLTQRTFGPTCTGTTELDTSGMKPGDRAGIIALQNRFAYLAVVADTDGKHLELVTSDGRTETVAAQAPLTTDRVQIRMSCDFRENRDQVAFSYRTGKEDWVSLGSTHRLSYDLVHFMGCRFGLFNFATKEVGGHADFDHFRIGE